MCAALRRTEAAMGKVGEQVLAVLTGAVGDWLAATGNALATPTTLVHAGQPLAAERAALQAALPDAGPRIVLLIHGLMATEHGFALGELATADYGDLLRQHKAMTPLRVRYNSGLPVAALGRELDELLAQVVAQWPVAVQDITLVCHSMGGLVARAAWGSARTAKHPWPDLVRNIVYLATPHLGAPLERAGRSLTAVLRSVPDPVAQVLSQMADLRSAGIQQLGDPAQLPWPQGPRQLLVAGSLVQGTPLEAVVGDGMVSVKSALADDAQHPRPADSDTRVVAGASHPGIAFSPAVAEILLAWLPQAPARRRGKRAAPVAPPVPTPSAPRATAGGVIQLGMDAAKAGHRTVAQVRLGRADQALAAVHTLAPALSAPAEAVHAVHAGVVALQHAAIDAGISAAQAVHGAVRPKPPSS